MHRTGLVAASVSVRPVPGWTYAVTEAKLGRAAGGPGAGERPAEFDVGTPVAEVQAGRS
jgi:hypothetical protein